MNNISIAIHGGAGTITRSSMTETKEAKYKKALKDALDAGYDILLKGASSLEAVEMAVIVMEDCPLFNAGKGSVFTSKGEHEMDASIMSGRNMDAGAVALLTKVKNPISLARMVMEKSNHVFLAGKGAEEFASEMQTKFESQKYFHDDFRHKQWLEIKDSDETQLDHSIAKNNKFGTVGAVALDKMGNLAAATSTGGMTNKKYGRIGDSSIIGAGTYANNLTCAVSCTGNGEYFIRGVAAYDVSCLMEMKGLDLGEACREVVKNRLHRIGGDGGLIACDTYGNIAMEFNTEGMYRGQKSSIGSSGIHIYS